MTSTVWRLKTNPDSDGLENVANFCLANNVVAVGWSLKDGHFEEQLEGMEKGKKQAVLAQFTAQRNSISTFEEYKKLFMEVYKDHKEMNGNIVRLRQMKSNDFVWMHANGKYYAGLVTDESCWKYDCSDEALVNDTANQITNIDWFFAGDENCVPGAVCTAFAGSGQTLRKIPKEGIKKFTQHLYNKTKNTNYFVMDKLVDPMKSFFEYISTDGCEDLLCLWLYKNYGYVTIPSTNKKSTQLYECVLLDPNTGKRIYVQVKSGAVDIDAAAYMQFAAPPHCGEVWLFTVGGKILNPNPAINEAKPIDLYNFAIDPTNINLLSDNLLLWRDFLLHYK